MAISLAEMYTGILDDYFKANALTANMETNAQFVRGFDNAGTIQLLEMDLHGPGDYDRTTGFPAGSITTNWRPYTIAEDRGVSFNLDVMDGEEGMLTMASVAQNFMSQFMIPEVDAYRFARIAGKTDAGQTVAANLTVSTIMGAIDTAKQVLMDNEVPESSLTLYMSNTAYNLLMNNDKIQNHLEVRQDSINLNRNIKIYNSVPLVTVPKSRFYSEITLNDGATTWGYAKAVGAKDINFILAGSDAVNAITRHSKTRMFSADTNQSADASKFDYRLYHDLIVPQRKINALYTHTVA